MSTQPEALRLADLLERDPSEWGGLTLGWKAAAELRRLHEVNAELLEALKELKAVIPVFPKDADCIVGYRDRYNAALAKSSAVIDKAKAGGEV